VCDDENKPAAMQSWNSKRFAKTIHLTGHAMRRMVLRGIAEAEITELIETGVVRKKDAEHWWIYKDIPGRDDNLVCAAVISRQAIIIKTIMTHWEEREG
jgi:hypothetical protein